MECHILLFLSVFAVFLAFSDTRVKAGQACGTINGLMNRRSRRLIVFRDGKTFSVGRYCGGTLFRRLKGLPEKLYCKNGKWQDSNGKVIDVKGIVGNSRYPCERIVCKVPVSWLSKLSGLAKSYRPGTELKFLCPAKHRPSETFKQFGGKIACQRGGLWNIGKVPLGILCEAITCKWPPPKRQNVRFTYPNKRDKMNVQAIFICARYHGVKRADGRWKYNMKIPCNHTTGKWMDSNLQCQSLKCSPPPKDLVRATTTSNSTVAIVRCKSKFVNKDGHTKQVSYPCRWNKQGHTGFHIPTDVCLHCRSMPKIPEHVSLTMTTSTRIDYKCKDGYEFYDGRKQRISLCTVYKHWQGWIPKELVKCGAIVPKCQNLPKVGSAEGTRNRLVGKYKCEKGYIFPGGVTEWTTRCDPTSGWPRINPCLKAPPGFGRKPTEAPTEDPTNVYNYF